MKPSTAYDEWKPTENGCDGTYRDPKLNDKKIKIWYDQCGKNNRECTITVSNARLSDTDDWYCTVEPCEMIKGKGCVEKGTGGPNGAKVFVKVRGINIK